MTEEVRKEMLLGNMQSHGGDMDGKAVVIDALTKNYSVLLLLVEFKDLYHLNYVSTVENLLKAILSSSHARR